MDLSVFFERIPQDVSSELEQSPQGSLGKQINRFDSSFPIWEDADLVLIGGRSANQEEEASEADQVRLALYALSAHSRTQRLADLGNLKPKSSYEDYLQALAYVAKSLIAEGKIVLVMGGDQSQTIGLVQAYDEVPYPISYVQVDKKFDLNFPADTPDAFSYNRYLLEDSSNWLYSFTNLGYQRFEVTDDEREFLSDRHFGSYRLGELTPSPKEAEPELRMADMLSFDMSSMRFAEAPASAQPSPAGFDASQACTLARYAGMGYRLSSFLISDFSVERDIHSQTSKMAALLVWYLLDGIYNRWEDKPQADRSNLRKYAVQLHASIDEIPFYKHPLSGRWWMEVPHPDSLGKTFSESQLVPCSEMDYEFAKTDNIPSRWWQAYYRMMK